MMDTSEDCAFGIEHLTGGFAGKMQRFPAGLKEIPLKRLVGPDFYENGTRDDEITFHPQDKLVSRDGQGKISVGTHGKFEDYRFIPRSGYYVAINGKGVSEDTLLKDGDEIELGNKPGIRIRFTVNQFNRSSSIGGVGKGLNTGIQGEILNIRDWVQHRVYQVGLFAILLTAGLTAIWIFKAESTEDRISRISAELREKIDNAGKRTFRPEVLNDLEASTHLIAIKASTGTMVIGTGWAKDPQTFVTNAHVARIFSNLLKDQELVAIQSKTGKQRELKRPPEFHPGYKAHKAFLKRNPVGIEKSSSGFEEVSFIEAYDLAYFNVDSSQPFKKSLSVANLGLLKSLPIGTKIAYAGFPSENTRFSKINHIKANPITQFGQITGLSTFFGLPADENSRNFLIHHNLPAEPGASGSPIINSEGNVVAVLNAGNIVEIKDTAGNRKRISNPVQINFAQRADLLNSMSQGDLFVRREKKFWKKSRDLFPSRMELLEKHFENVGARLFKRPFHRLANRTRKIRRKFKKTGIVSFSEFEVPTGNADEIAIFLRSTDRSRIRAIFTVDGEEIKPFKIEEQPDYVMAFFHSLPATSIIMQVQSRSSPTENLELLIGNF